MELRRQIGLTTAVLIIIADVIGTGIFMTTGNILGITQNSFHVLILWVLGGIVAVTGALCYAELASRWPNNGGEYVYLKEIYGPLPAFLTGWVSLIVGFSAPAAISSMTVFIYLKEFFINIDAQSINVLLENIWIQKIGACSIVFIFGIMHIIGVKRGSIVQNLLTVLKLFIVCSLIILGFYFIDWGDASRLTAQYVTIKEPSHSVFTYGGALLMIMFAYSGWNGATYIAGEVKDPERNMPRALFIGVVSIMVLYILLNIIFLMGAPGSELIGEEAVGAIATKELFANKGLPFDVSSAFTLAIALILLSSVSVLMMIGPRVYHAMAQNKMIFNSLSGVHKKFKTPHFAIVTQMIIAIVYVLIGRDNIMYLLIYMGFALNIFPLMSVVGMMIERYKNNNQVGGFKTPLFPLVPIIFIVLTLTMMLSALLTWGWAPIIALVVVVAGIPVFYIWQYFVKKT